MPHFQVIELPSIGDARGIVTIVQDILPFPINRVFWIYDADYQVRGGHRHYLTCQALVAIHGSITVHMDDNHQTEDIILNSPSHCLLVEPKDFHHMTFEKGAILLVMASHIYDAADYIHEPYMRKIND